MNYALGLCLLGIAAVVAIWGDRSLQEKGGVVLKTFSWPKSRASLLKLPIAAILAGVGVWVFLRG